MPLVWWPLLEEMPARLLATHPGELADYDLTTGGLDRITPELPPMVALPTTAGTGTEAGHGVVQARTNAFSIHPRSAMSVDGA